mmetsp:Transcript_3474/g.8221  ORF Transcript_3474/g.8221 Transcript_3474/m.8221 type:complete len:201 (-) Transcript_3474:1249-1851(-)
MHLLLRRGQRHHRLPTVERHTQLAGSTMVSIHEELLELVDEWVTRVSPGALVVKCHRSHSVELGREVVPCHPRVFNGQREVDVGLEGLKPVDKGPDLVVVCVACVGDSECIRNLCISCNSHRVFILREGSHLHWRMGRVEGDDMAEHQGVSSPMGNVELCAKLMSKGMADSKKGIGEGHPGDRRAVVHVLPCELVTTVLV